MDKENINQDSLDVLYEKPKMSKKDRFKNFVYYNKATIIVIALAVTVLIILMGQVVTKVEPDVYVMYAGRFYLDPNSYESIQGVLTDRMGYDYNKDGKIKVEIISKTVKTKELNEQQKEEMGEELYTGNMAEALSAFRSEIAAGESVILFLDELLYEDVANEGRLLPLKDALGYKPEGAIDEYGIYLKDTPFADACPEFEGMLDNTVVCVKRRVLTCDEDVYQNNLKAFKKLFEEKE